MGEHSGISAIPTTEAQSEDTLAGRVERIVRRVDYDLADLLQKGGRPAPAAVLNAIDEAHSAAVMLSCAMIGAPEYFGGQPADHVVSRWAYIMEQKMELARVLASEALEDH